MASYTSSYSTSSSQTSRRRRMEKQKQANSAASSSNNTTSRSRSNNSSSKSSSTGRRRRMSATSESYRNLSGANAADAKSSNEKDSTSSFFSLTGMPKTTMMFNTFTHLPIRETNEKAIFIATKLEEEKKEREPVGRTFDVAISKAFDIVEQYMAEHGAVLFGGTAFNLIAKSLPQSSDRKSKALQKYIMLESNEHIDVTLTVDYDIFIPNGKMHAERICRLLHEAGLPNVEGSTNLHYGTYKIYVDFVPLVDVHSFPNELFPVLQRQAHKYKLSTLYPSVPHPNLKVYVASPDFLRMEIYKELAKPDDNPGRWKKLTTRLSILNRYFTLTNKVIRNSDGVAVGENRVCQLNDGNIQQCVGDRAVEMKSIRQRFAAALGSDLVTQKQADEILKGVYLEVARYISTQKLILTGMTALTSFVRSRVSFLKLVRVDSYPLNMPPVEDVPDYDVYATGPTVGYVNRGVKRAFDDVPMGEIHARKIIDMLQKKLIFIVRDAMGKNVEDTKLHKIADSIRFAQCNYGVITDILPPHSMVTLVVERQRKRKSTAASYTFSAAATAEKKASFASTGKSMNSTNSFSTHNPQHNKFAKSIIDVYHDSACTGFVKGTAVMEEDGSTLEFRIGSVATLLQLWFTWLFLSDPKLDMGSGNKSMLATCPKGKFRREHKQAKIICAIEYLLENQTHLDNTPFSIFSKECDTSAMLTKKPGTSGQAATTYREQIREYRALRNKWRWSPERNYP